ncbi:MAG: lactate utilization protein [Alphaproteobacteria bacterium]|jgi:L-lactate dehydrogenase complex protein LldG|nr:lactate utilization protein [Alphaproteobacteria bacterium]PPR14075.1 MAG: Lactate utilization protein C [Alphaproteobacteria bacterium MarineAlpha12_Bin1]|tara:strand:+ start:45509 stop:46210 length:702 start_codon:yes stop_codon:yes gene_type:complete
MSEQRQTILNNVRRSLGRSGPLDKEKIAALKDRISTPKRNLIPQRTSLTSSDLITLFKDMAEGVFASVEEVESLNDIPSAITNYLKKENLPSQVVMSSDQVLDSIPWGEQPLLGISNRTPERDDMVSVTSAAAGVAETGTLAMFSGPDHPSTLNFLPETHVVVLPKDRITKNYEDVWDMIRNNNAMGDPSQKKDMPRTVNFITGPSRSGDIEQTLLLGAHGPRRLHIILVESD